MFKTRLTPPIQEPVSLSEQKDWLKIDGNAEDAVLTSLIAAARAHVELATRRCLMAQTWRVVLDHWPMSGVVRLPISPVMSVDKISVVGQSGETILATSLYALVDAQIDPTLVPALRPPSPDLPDGRIQIDVVCGYGANPSDVPDALRLAIKQLVADWYVHRGDGDQNPGADISTLILPFKRIKL